ncbi:MAG: hypothetical protein US81_C0009G0016 [Parcubacteria group bacterium GW2011_GWE2_38_18]|nr:MAG: hypothetical protein US81_C0009G0016 [Parcubacteria group bacterium GW2011_GWE2_38_18]
MFDMKKIIPFLWFDHQAEEAVNFYVSIFKNSRVLKTTLYMKEAVEVSGKPEGSVMTVEFQLNGHDFIALNGGPEFIFTPAISFVVNCENQQEVDELWERLSNGGEEQQCGWVQDKYGVSWQIVPEELDDLLNDPDKEKAGRVMKAMLSMNKIEIEALRRA